ncbi:MAG: helix-turn-helix transcriptional regulator [Sphingomonadaceae bacterium]|nr:helix-turn-helix transcriptional regulator [Sphingomonadaceae bacterium]
MRSGMDSQTVLFKSLSDPTRRALFERLCREGELTVGLLAEGSGVSQPAISKHLAALDRANLVALRREGRNTHCRARPEGITPLTDWVQDMSRFWDVRLDALEDLLRRMDQ